jgi:GNAT superfamily N-acetyltransferase
MPPLSGIDNPDFSGGQYGRPLVSQSDHSTETHGHVRPIQRHDLPVVSDLIARLAEHHGDQPEIDMAHLEADLFAPAPWVHGLVVEHSGVVVGYALMIPRYRAQRTQRGFDMHHLFVLEDSRGRGLGRQLVASVIAYAREARCDFLVVGTAADNNRAQDFYRSFGFEARDYAGRNFGMSLQ